MQDEPAFSRWFRKLRGDIDELARGGGNHERLVRLQNALVDLVGYLDPKGLKCPMDRRDKVPVEDVSIP